MDSCVTAALAARTIASPFFTPTTASARRPRARLLPSPGRSLPCRASPGRGLPGPRAIGGSSLTDPAIPVREGEPEKGRVPSSYVPFRNAHLLAAATSWGEVLGAAAVFVGAVEEDSSGYPDCRPEFYRAFQQVVGPGHAARDAHPDRDPGDRDVQGGHRAPGAGAPGALRDDVVVLPGGGHRVRRVRIVPAAAPRLRGGGRARPLALSRAAALTGPRWGRNRAKLWMFRGPARPTWRDSE